MTIELLFSSGSITQFPKDGPTGIGSCERVALQDLSSSSPLDCALDVLIYVEQSVRADRRVATAE